MWFFLILASMFGSALLFMAACQLFLGETYFVSKKEEERLDKSIEESLAIIHAKDPERASEMARQIAKLEDK
jgi:predicted NAD-dependent protein-ADP-ribosyltransferase YbiA (DUF1768 family)